METGWLGDLPTWITTLAIVIAVLQFAMDRSRRKEEQERERREQARQLTTWVATYPKSPREYMIILSNTSGSTFHDVSVSAVIHGEKVAPLNLNILPPGEFFVQYDPENNYTWRFAQSVDACTFDELRPYMKSNKYRIISADFTDNADVRWHTDDRARLTEAQESRSNS